MTCRISRLFVGLGMWMCAYQVGSTQSALDRTVKVDIKLAVVSVRHRLDFIVLGVAALFKFGAHDIETIVVAFLTDGVIYGAVILAAGLLVRSLRARNSNAN